MTRADEAHPQQTSALSLREVEYMCQRLARLDVRRGQLLIRC
jgi:hypothetical protein